MNYIIFVMFLPSQQKLLKVSRMTSGQNSNCFNFEQAFCFGYVLCLHFEPKVVSSYLILVVLLNYRST